MRSRPHPAVRDLASGRCTVAQFRDFLTRHGTPLLERCSDEEVDVTFVHELAENDPARADQERHDHRTEVRVRETEVRLRELVGSGPTGDRYREYAGGHDATWWRATWADGLRWLFPVDRDPTARLRSRGRTAGRRRVGSAGSAGRPPAPPGPSHR